MGGISDDDDEVLSYSPEREYAILSPPKGDKRMTSSRVVEVEDVGPDKVVLTKKAKAWTRVTNNDLPAGAHDEGRFRHAYIPCNIWWMAFQLDPFKAGKGPRLLFMRRCWKVIYGNTVPHKVRVNDPVFRLVKQRLSDGLRSRIGTAAISVVNAFFESEQTMLKDFKFLYSNTESSNPKKWKGLSRGPFVVHTFNAHFIATSGAVKVKAYGDLNGVGQLPCGGLSLLAAAVERALKLYEVGAIPIEIVEAGRGTNKISLKPVLNKATGKTSAKSFAFNKANWGSATRGYIKSVQHLRPDRFVEIIEIAGSFLDRSEHRERAAGPNDIHANENMVDLSDDE